MEKLGDGHLNLGVCNLEGGSTVVNQDGASVWVTRIRAGRLEVQIPSGSRVFFTSPKPPYCL